MKPPSPALVTASLRALALTSALALPGCTQPGSPHGWSCQLRPMRIHRDSATATWDSGKGTIPGIELRCTQR